MDDKHLLNVNPYKVLKCLEGILDVPELEKIRTALTQNGNELIALADSHIVFSETVTGGDSWRQKVSRGYYGCYTASRAVRLVVHGHYDPTVQDHKKIAELPDDFPNRETWIELLTKFRADRNIADYDHTVGETALEMDANAYVGKAKEFVQEVKGYFSARGAT